MLLLWVILAAVLYFLFLTWMLVFFARVARMSPHPKSALQRMPDARDSRPGRRPAA